MNFTTSVPLALANVSFTLRVTVTWSYVREGKARSRKRQHSRMYKPVRSTSPSVYFTEDKTFCQRSQLR